MERPEYNAEIDWASYIIPRVLREKHPVHAYATFNNKSELMTADEFNFMWNSTDDPNYQAFLYTTYYVAQLKKEKEQSKIIKLLLGETSEPSYFITIGFDKDNFSKKLFETWIHKLLDKRWYSEIKLIIEFYGKEGWRPHVHLKLNSPYSKSKIIDTLYGSSGFKSLANSKNHIDVKYYNQEIHDNYLSGEKSTEKKALVEKDKSFRSENGYQEKYTKVNL